LEKATIGWMLLRGGRIATLDPPRVEIGDLRVEKGVVAGRGPALAPLPGEELLELRGALLLPGLVNAHTHLYSSLARGMPPPVEAPRSFIEILQRVWWRLDRALDEESVFLSGLAGAVEAALSGTTLLVDHHASPSFIRGSLSTLRRAVEEVGLRSVLCYETTDRNGEAGRDVGIEENVAFAREARGKLTRGMIGAHASLTLSDATLGRLAEAVRETGECLHIHVAEDLADVCDAQARSGCGIPERLRRAGVLDGRKVFAHAVHLSPDELATAQAQGAWIVHNPRSNMNNAVGYAPTAALHRAALGTDGMDQDMFAELRAAFLKARDMGRTDAGAMALEMLSGGHRLAAAMFGLPFGKLDAGAPADLVILDYDSPTPVTAQNLGGHLLFAIDRSHVRSVLVAGRFVVRDRRLVTVDREAVLARCRVAAESLWQRMQAL
jgi:putative selenium metabolism protein SsnA